MCHCHAYDPIIPSSQGALAAFSEAEVVRQKKQHFPPVPCFLSSETNKSRLTCVCLRWFVQCSTMVTYHWTAPFRRMWCFYFWLPTTFKQIQVDGRFQTLLQWYFYTQKWRKRWGCLVSNDFCLRPIWCGYLFFFLLVHMEPPPGSKSKMLKWNPTCWNASHHQFATKNLKQQPYVQPKITNQECLKSMGRFFCLNHRSSERLQSTVNTSIINYWTCIFMYKPPKCDFNKGIQPKKFPWSKALGITGTI